MPLISAKHKLFFQNLLGLAFPQLGVLLLIRLLHAWFGLNLPTWSRVVVQVISLPIVFAVRIWASQLQVTLKATRWGAIFPPMLVGKSIGNYDILVSFLKFFSEGYLGESVSEWLDQFGGTINFRVLWESRYLTSDAGVIKSMLTRDFSKFDKGEEFKSAMHSVLGTGVFNADGEMWKFHRAMTRPFFTRERVDHFGLFDKHAEQAIMKMKDRLRSGYALDFQDLIARYTLDVATEFLFGSCVQSLGTELPYPFHPHAPAVSQTTRSASDEFSDAFLEAQEALSNRGRTGWSWPWFELFQSKTEKPMRVVDAYLKPIIDRAVQQAERAKQTEIAQEKPSTGKEGEGETLLDHLVKLTTDRTVLHDEVLNILIAGRDTTATSLTFAVYFLCVYPRVFERLRREILEVVGPSARPTLEDIRDMKYLRAVINETLRLYPAVPFNLRCANQDTTLPNPHGKPFFVPAKTSVIYSVFLMHRRTDYWGPDAQEFDPDRFMDDRVTKYLTRNPFIFLPFNAGPRICLGQQYAYNEMSFFLVRLLQNFSSMSLDLKSQAPETRPPASWKGLPGRKGIEQIFPKTHITIYSYGGLWVKMGEAEAAEAN